MSIDTVIEKPIKKHRSTIAPFECNHCGRVWYGWTSHHPSTLPDTVFCPPCWSVIDNFIYRKHGLCEESTEAKKDAATWIQDKKNKPYPRTPERRFHPNVPKWMRSAIMNDMVKTNSKEVYIVYTQEGVAIKVELTDRSTLKPVKVRL